MVLPAAVTPMSTNRALLLFLVRLTWLHKRRRMLTDVHIYVTADALLSNIQQLTDRYHETWQLEDVEQRIALLCGFFQKNSSATIGRTRRANLYLALANAHGDHYIHTSKVEDLAERVRLCEEALTSLLDDHPSYPTALLEFGCALRMRFEQSTDVADVQRAVQIHEQVLALNTTSPPRFLALCELGISYYRLFNSSTSNIDSIEKALTYLRDALDACPADDPGLPYVLDHLGMAITALSTKRERTHYLEEAISLHNRSLKILVPNHRDRDRGLHGTGVAWYHLFRLSSENQHLRTALENFKNALKFRPVGHPGRSA
jgi:tetratricopeptide (TPR) repeat protein